MACYEDFKDDKSSGLQENSYSFLVSDALFRLTSSKSVSGHNLLIGILGVLVFLYISDMKEAKCGCTFCFSSERQSQSGQQYSS